MKKGPFSVATFIGIRKRTLLLFLCHIEFVLHLRSTQHSAGATNFLLRPHSPLYLDIKLRILSKEAAQEIQAMRPSSTRKLKRRRTSLSEASLPGTPRFELQCVPDQKKRSFPKSASSQPTSCTMSHDKTTEVNKEPASLRKAPSFLLTTPEGRDMSAVSPGYRSPIGASDEDEWDTEDEDEEEDVDNDDDDGDDSNEDDDDDDDQNSPPLLSEPVKTPTKQHRPPPPVPKRPATSSVLPSTNTFVLAPLAKLSDDVILLSPFADPQEDAVALEEPASWWSFSSSSGGDSSDSSSSSNNSYDSDSSDDEASYTLQRYPPQQLGNNKDDLLVSFPALLSPETQAFLDQLDPEDMRDAETLLVDEVGLARAVESVEDDWADVIEEEEEEEVVVDRPLPRWAWLTSSNSFPVFRASKGPRDLKHGSSKLRMVMSVGGEEEAVDDEGESEMKEEGVRL